MGHPRRQKKKFQRPKKPYDKTRIGNEKKIMKEFGLRQKKDIWKAQSLLRNYRRRARNLLANPNPDEQKILFEKMANLGFNCQSLEDILGLDVNSLLARRLQTILHKMGLATSIRHARQLIIHRHVLINGQRIAYPSYLVNVNEEDKIELDNKIKEKAIKESPTE